jgi:phosphopantothenoylcysteine decarboxylase/phosphopantothenate--cysteine ligase
MMYESLAGKKIILGITGSIAAFKSPMLIRELLRNGCEVRVVMTTAATEFVSPMLLANLTRHPVSIEMFDEKAQSGGAWHIELAHWCDAMAIVPCSAATMSKLATGLCDNALVTVAVALPPDKVFIVAPAMDSTMWLHPATQRNLETIKADGANIIMPVEGELASGLRGPGRLPEVEQLIDEIAGLIKKKA